MTPTPLFLLFVALFWTLPASLAAYAYRRNEYSLSALQSSIHHSIERGLNSVRAEQAHAQAER